MSRLPKGDPEHCQALALGEAKNLHREAFFAVGGGCVFSQVLRRGVSMVLFKGGF
jgi:hypothetical protein